MPACGFLLVPDKQLLTSDVNFSNYLELLFTRTVTDS